MGATVFTVRRMRQRTAAFVGVLVVAAVTAAVTAVCAGILSSAGTNGLRAALERQPGSSLALRSALPLASDPQQQDAAARAVLRTTFDDTGRRIPFDIERSVAVVTKVDYPATSSRTLVASVEGFADAATLVDGTWATSATTVSIQADAAQQLGLGLGDVIRIGPSSFTVTGTWRVDDAQGPQWLGERLWASGFDGSDVGPIVVDDAAWQGLNIDPQVRWTIVPDVALLEPADLGPIAAAWQNVPGALRDAGLGSPTQTGQFLRAADDVTVRLHALSGIGPAAAVVVAAMAALSLWALLGLLVEGRSSEIELLRLRGTTPQRLVASIAGEVALTALAGGGVGAVAGVVAVLAVNGGAAAGVAGTAALWGSVGVAVVAGMLAAVRAARILRPAPGASRTRRSAGVAAVVLLAAAAAVSTWQLLTFGALPPVAQAARGVDPVTIAAPALLLAAVVIAGVVAFSPLARIADARAAAAQHPALAVRAVARRARVVAVPIVLVGVAVGQLALAAGYAETWRTSFDQTVQLNSGTALRITAPSLTPADLAAAAAASGIRAVAPVTVEDVGVGGETATAVGIAPHAFAELGAGAGGLIDPPALAQVLDTGGLPAVPDGAAHLTVTADPAPTAGAVWLADEWGALRRVDLAIGAADGSGTAPIPDGRWRLAAVDLTPPAATDDDPRTVVLRTLTTDAGPVVLAGVRWTAIPVDHDSLSSGSPGDTAAVQLPPTADSARLIATPAATNVILSRALATALSVDEGDVISVAVGEGGVSLSADVARVIDAVPGGGGEFALLMDSAVTDAVSLGDARIPASPGVAWIGADDVAAASAALRSALRPTIAVSAPSLDPDLTMLRAAPQTMWITAAACLILALAGLIATTASQLRSRRAETSVLSAIGMSSDEQARSRRVELTLVTAWGAATGLIAGATAVLVVVATLARSAVPDADPAILTPVRFDLVAFAIIGAVFAAAVAAIVVGYGRAAGRVAQRTGAPGDPRAS